MRYDLEEAAKYLAKELAEIDGKDEAAMLAAIRDALKEAYAAGTAQS
jgi:hypothetical protein